MSVKIITKGGDKSPSVSVHPVAKLDGSDSLHEVQSNALSTEDAFQGLYVDSHGKGGVIRPPYDPTRLLQFVQENNTLAQCISAMEVNIDGAGHVIDAASGDADEDLDEVPEVVLLQDFFDEPWPRKSMTTLRRTLRRDLEGTGNAYIEVLRNPQDQIVFIRQIEAQTMRLMKLGAPVPVTKSITRAGKEMSVTLWMRERTFVQKVSGQTAYFREFGSSRDIDKVTGEWAEQGNRLPANRRGSEIIHLTVEKDVHTPYGVPRWINQLPSIIGSRKAEEYNLEFFDAGGIPPAVVFLQGGQVDPDSKKSLEKILSGKTHGAYRAAVVEMQSTSGDINSSSNVGVKVERFGNEQKNDSMFESYNEKNESRIRGAFRLPPLFLGKAESHNYATAYVSYMIAESQVFSPERDEFDEIMNATLVRDLLDGSKDYVYRTKSMPIKDAETQMKGIELAQPHMTGQDLLDAINETAGMNLKYDEDTPDPAELREGGEGGEGLADQLRKSEQVGSVEALKLANRWASLMGTLPGELEDGDSMETLNSELARLTKSERELFDAALASRMMVSSDLDFEGAQELCSCLADLRSGV